MSGLISIASPDHRRGPPAHATTAVEPLPAATDLASQRSIELADTCRGQCGGGAHWPHLRAVSRGFTAGRSQLDCECCRRQARERLPAGSMLGPYQIEAFLARGGVAQVYLARDLRQGRICALKTVATSADVHPIVIARLKCEARALGRFSHPCIPTCLELASYAGHSCLALQYIRGQTLQRLGQRRILPPGMILRLVSRLATTLSEIHRHNVVHRDLKPSNVIIGASNGLPYVIDFGLARSAKVESSCGCGLSGDGPCGGALVAGDAAFGTPAYMAPEQWRAQIATPASDIFALGVLMFELVYRRHPYTLRSPEETREFITGDRPIEVPTPPAAFPEPLGRCIFRCLNKRATLRPSARSVALVLRSLLRRALQPLDTAGLASKPRLH